MARRKATPVALTDPQRERLERLWFYYGNYGPAAAPGNHQFIQGLLEHGLDLRPLLTKRSPKSEKPTPECEQSVEAVLAADDHGKADVDRRVYCPEISTFIGRGEDIPGAGPGVKGES
jgi:hypothetical protein